MYSRPNYIHTSRALLLPQSEMGINKLKSNSECYVGTMHIPGSRMTGTCKPTVTQLMIHMYCTVQFVNWFKGNWKESMK